MSTEYFTEIESHFAHRRGTPFVLSSKDWVLMKTWHDEGIPLPIVIEAIDSVFDKAAERQKMVNSLRYCRHAVKELWNDRRELQIGAQENAPEEDVSGRLDLLAQALESVSPDFAARVRALVSEKSAPRIEERLIELEEELVESLLPRAEELRDEARASSRPRRWRARAPRSVALAPAAAATRRAPLRARSAAPRSAARSSPTPARARA
ncbi:MAG TPA: hypothetical protein VHK90_07855, partial [Thermoanaerobaculia bacterium]|nr:hypothetical protein [Thermoanaerobaculia bacterium]